MATPADQRLLELLDKWLESLELHIKYSTLDDDSYWKIQPWVEHQRPNGWILDLAKQKTLALKRSIEERVAMGDSKFADALELTIFLANLVGSEHIERFIPLAEPRNERAVELQAPDDAPTIAAAVVSGTREMPKFAATKRSPPPSGTAQVARTERRESRAPRTAAKHGSTAEPGEAARAEPADAAREQVIADAARLVQWGRKWYELPELIARMADRPPLPVVRRILKENKSAIDRRAEGE